jgi:hypothetical protein
MDKLYLVSTHTNQFELCFEKDGNYYVDLFTQVDPVFIKSVHPVCDEISAYKLIEQN